VHYYGYTAAAPHVPVVVVVAVAVGVTYCVLYAVIWDWDWDSFVGYRQSALVVVSGALAPLSTILYTCWRVGFPCGLFPPVWCFPPRCLGAAPLRFFCRAWLLSFCDVCCLFCRPGVWPTARPTTC